MCSSRGRVGLRWDEGKLSRSKQPLSGGGKLNSILYRWQAVIFSVYPIVSVRMQSTTLH